jgi:hypothetical protein
MPQVLERTTVLQRRMTSFSCLEGMEHQVITSRAEDRML